VLCPMALLRGCAWTETRYYSIMALEEAQLLRIMCLPGSHKTSVALYALMEHRISPAIRLIEWPTINAPKFISSYVRIHLISSPPRYVKDSLEIKSRKAQRRCRHNSTAKWCNKIYSIQNHPQIYREKP
jgi:hypothetical protein